MAKRQAKKVTHPHNPEEMVQVDAFMIPAPFAEMYQVLRQAVAEDVETWLEHHYPMVTHQFDEVEGEAIVAFDQNQVKQFSFYLNPHHISEAQKARDKGQMETMLLQMIEKQNSGK